MSSDAREQALIDAIVDSPDEEAYSVYADFVMERGGPLGELVEMMLGDGDEDRVRALVDDLGHRDIWIHAWDAGFPSEITLDVADRDEALLAIQALVDLPLYALVRVVRLVVVAARPGTRAA